MQQTFELMERYDIVGVASGPRTTVETWAKANPRRVIPAAFTNWGPNSSIDSLRTRIVRGDVRMIGEVTTQYGGLSAADDRFEEYWDLAEELDVPISIHVGPGPPGTAYNGSPRYTASLSSALHLERALVRHPAVRVNVMHAGWPMLDDMLAVLYAHPQVNVDLGVISFLLPRDELYRYVETIVEAGFGQRVMFGSDQMIWPDALERAINAIEEAPFLDDHQRRDIFYNNAARFLRLPGQ